MGKAKVFQNFVGGTTKSKIPANMGAEWSCNMYPETNGGQTYMKSTPGFKRISADTFTETSGCVGSYVSTRGAGVASEDCFAALLGADTVTAKIYKIATDGTPTLIGSLSYASSKVTFAETGGERPLLLVCDGRKLYYYDLKNGGSLVEIAMPERIDGSGEKIRPVSVAVVSGSIVVNDSGSGYVYYSNPYPLSQSTRSVYDIDSSGNIQYESDGITVKKTTVDSATYVFYDDYQTPQYFNGESSSDAVNAIYSVGSALYLFGPKSVETWQRGSADYETWIRTSYTINSVNGLAAVKSLASIDDCVFYVGSGNSMGFGVMMLKGTSFTKVSPHWLDEKLSALDYGFCYSIDEHRFYCLQTSSGETWVYDSSNGTWHQRTVSSTSFKGNTSWPVRSVSWFNGHLFAFDDRGNVGYIDDGYYNYDFFHHNRGDEMKTLPLVRVRQSPAIVDNYANFVLEEVALECNVGTIDDPNADPKIMLEVSRDGGNTFGQVRTTSIGKSGEYSHRVRFVGLGLNRQAVLRVTYSEPTDFVISGCEIRAESTGGLI